MIEKLQKWLYEETYNKEYSNLNEKEQEGYQEKSSNNRLHVVSILIVLGFVLLTLHLVYLDSQKVQSFGAIISLIGIFGEIFILQNQSIDYKDEDGEITDDAFTKTRYFHIVNIICYFYIIVGTVIWAYYPV